MSRGDNASPYSVRRSRRPQTRLENFIHENREIYFVIVSKLLINKAFVS